MEFLKTVETYFLWLMIYSIIGWIYESTLCSITNKKLINRGFLNGPYCPIYGSGAILVILILGRIKKSCASFLPRCARHLFARISDFVCYGKTVPCALVGLFAEKIQH